MKPFDDSIPEEIETQHAAPITKLASRPFAVRRGKRIARFASMLAAVLVVAAIISASLLLFTHRPQGVVSSLPQSAPIGPVGTPVTVHTQAGGLEASMSLTSGPYFLSELLAVDLS